MTGVGQEPEVTYDAFYKMIDTARLTTQWKDEKYNDPLVDFVSEITYLRAYIYCCTSGSLNSNKFAIENFISGVSRFGIENPIPVVSQRCQLYGNSRNINEMLKKAEEKYGKTDFKIDTSKYREPKQIEENEHYLNQAQLKKARFDRN